VELKVNDWQMNAWTSWAYGIIKVRQGMAGDQCVLMWWLRRQVFWHFHWGVGACGWVWKN